MAKPKLSSQQKQEICRRYSNGENGPQLGAHFNVTPRTISRVLKQHGVPARTSIEAHGGFSKAQETEVCRRYAAGESTVRLAACFGVNPNRISKTLKRSKIERRSIAEANTRLDTQQEEQVVSRYLDGENSAVIAGLYGVSPKTITNILGRRGIECRRIDGISDSIQHALDCTGHHSHPRECYFYLFSLARYGDTHCKPGISFDVEARTYAANGEYGDEHFRACFATRQEAFFLEQAVLCFTSAAASCPADLQKWSGAGEIRALPAEEAIPVIELLLDEMEELGAWDFAALRVPMTAAQRALCQQRGLQESRAAQR